MSITLPRYPSIHMNSCQYPKSKPKTLQAYPTTHHAGPRSDPAALTQLSADLHEGRKITPSPTHQAPPSSRHRIQPPQIPPLNHNLHRHRKPTMPLPHIRIPRHRIRRQIRPTRLRNRHARTVHKPKLLVHFHNARVIRVHDEAYARFGGAALRCGD